MRRETLIQQRENEKLTPHPLTTNQIWCDEILEDESITFLAIDSCMGVAFFIGWENKQNRAHPLTY